MPRRHSCGRNILELITRENKRLHTFYAVPFLSHSVAWCGGVPLRMERKWKIGGEKQHWGYKTITIKLKGGRIVENRINFGYFKNIESACFLSLKFPQISRLYHYSRVHFLYDLKNKIVSGYLAIAAELKPLLICCRRSNIRFGQRYWHCIGIMAIQRAYKPTWNCS